jgi:hypothetical protein
MLVVFLGAFMGSGHEIFNSPMVFNAAMPQLFLDILRIGSLLIDLRPRIPHRSPPVSASSCKRPNSRGFGSVLEPTISLGLFTSHPRVTIPESPSDNVSVSSYRSESHNTGVFLQCLQTLSGYFTVYGK